MIPLLLTIAALATPHADVVNAHWHGYAQQRADVRYLSLEHIADDRILDWHAATMFAVSSASRGESLANHLPKILQGTKSYYADLESLKWSASDLLKVLETYPYSADKNPLVIRADWLLDQLFDTRDSNAYYLLLYGEKDIPKSDADFLEFWGVDEKQQAAGVTIGWDEENSQVNPHGTRYVERFITAGNNSFGLSLWRTKDSFFVTAENDPLEGTLDGNFLHQGRELIAQFPKSHWKNGKIFTGAAQAYLLAQGNANRANKPLDAAEIGKRVEEAPPDLVRDYNDCLGAGAILNNVSCVVCHNAGMKFPTANGLEQRLRMGVELHVYDRGKKEQVEEFHLTNAAIEIEQDNRRYAEFIEACTGLSTVDLSKLIKRVTDEYRADLSLEDAARELYCTPDDLRLALAYASTPKNQILLNGRLAELAHGHKLPRTQWEQEYLRAKAMIGLWRSGNVTRDSMAAVLGTDRKLTDEAPDKLRFAMVITTPPGAEVYLNDRKSTQSGPRHVFAMKVKADWKSKVTVTAVLGEQRESKEIECKAGETVEVAMNFEASGVKS